MGSGKRGGVRGGKMVDAGERAHRRHIVRVYIRMYEYVRSVIWHSVTERRSGLD